MEKLLGTILTFGNGKNADAFQTTTVCFEADDTIDERKERPVTADANIFARMNLRATLTNDDVAGTATLTTIKFHAAVLRIAVTTVTAGTLTFLMSHCLLSYALQRNADFRIGLTMTLLTGIVFRTEFIHDNFASTCMTNDCTSHVCIFDNGLTNTKSFAFANGEDFKFNRGANFGIQGFNAQNIVLCNAILLTTCANHSVHFLTSKIWNKIPARAGRIEGHNFFAPRKDGAYYTQSHAKVKFFVKSL